MLRSIAAKRSFARPQGFHPLHRSGDWPFKAPADDEQHSDGNQRYFHQRAQERMAPEARSLGIDVAGIMDYNQRSRKPLFYVQWGLIDVQIFRVEPEKRIGRVKIDLRRGKSVRRKMAGQAGSDGHRRLMLIVNRDPSQMLAVPKSLHQMLQVAIGALLQYRLNAFLKAFSEYFGAPLQVLPENPPLCHELKVREQR